jgi:AraC-like DNA-binding protein
MNDAQTAKLSRSGTQADFVSAIVVFGMSKGIPAETFAEAMGMPLHQLADPRSRVPDRVVGAAWRTLGDHFPGEAVGLQMAQAAPLNVFGLLAQATRYSPTGRDAVETIVRYSRTVSGGADMRLEVEGDSIVLHAVHELDEVDGGIGAEAGLRLGARLGREMHGISELRRVEFRYDLRGPKDVYEDFFGTQVVGGTGRNVVVYDPAVLDCVPAQPDATMYRFVQNHLDFVCDQLVAQVTDSPLDRVRRTIAEQGQQGRFSAQHVAKAMGMSLRTLQRHVTKHGGALRDLMDEAREAQANRLLQDDRLSIAEVAFLVGYADDRAFRRAFKRWTGATPVAYRSSLATRT